MTITAELYDQINMKLIQVLEQYQNQLTQYDMLTIAVNLLVSYMEVIIRFDQLDKELLIDDVIHLIKTSDFKSFVSRN